MRRILPPMLLRLLGLASILWLACGPPPPQVHVTWEEPIDLVVGSPVNYQGLRIGTVARVALQQEDPQGAAVVSVTIEVEDPSVTLRRSDRFHLSSSGGVPAVEVRPWDEPSEPLPDGAVVPGVPPLMTRVEGQIDEVLESLGAAALEAIDAAIEAIDGELIEDDDQAMEPDAVLPPTAPGPAPAPGPDPTELSSTDERESP